MPATLRPELSVVMRRNFGLFAPGRFAQRGDE